MPTYIALLRGINVGGNKKVPMADLKKLLEKSGYANVKTLLASGNVIFDAKETNAKKLRDEIEKIIEKKFGFTVPTLIRSKSEIEKLLKAAPFKGVKAEPEVKFYVTFFSDKPKSTLKSGEGYKVLESSPTEICVALDVTMHTVDFMAHLEKAFGKNITTRNWNTVEKLLK